MTEINGRFNTQYLRVESSDIDINELEIEWFIVNHEAYIFRNLEYYVSFEGEFTETVTCNATKKDGTDNNSASVTIEAAYGSFHQTGNENGIFKMDSCALQNAAIADTGICDGIESCYIYPLDGGEDLSVIIILDRS